MRKLFWSSVARLIVAGIVGVAILTTFVLVGRFFRNCDDGETAISGPFSVGCLPSEASHR